MQEPDVHPSRADDLEGRVVALAWLAPAASVATVGVWRMLSGADTSPGVALAAILSGLWLGSFALPGWRGTLLAIGRLLATRVHFVVLLLLAACLWLVAARRGALWLGVCLATTLLAATGFARAWRRDRRQLAFVCVLLLLNVVLIAGIDVVVGRYLLPGRSHNNIFTTYDPLLGWKLRPGISVERRNDAYRSRETINAEGFRTPELARAKPPGVRRVLFLGDSHTEAYTVNDDETYPRQVAELLVRSLPVEVISLGVGGYSTDQELLAYLHYGRHYAPDLVVLQFSDNDPPFNLLSRYWRGRKPRFERYGDLLLLTGVPVPNLRNTGLFSRELLSRSALLVQVESALSQLAIRHEVEFGQDEAEAWRVTELLIRDLARSVQSDGARLVAFQADPEPNPRLLAALLRLGIPFIETGDVYVGDPDSYWVANHWNQKGQRVVAERLAPELRRHLEPELASD